MSHVCGSGSVGLYCLPPGCSPELEDEAPYPLAASAEAIGLRACRVCRPYRLPQVAARNAPELVCRAVRLVVDGALDQGDEAALGVRIGLSGRHLRRLFMTYVGVTPDGVARSCRAHFARRLLDDSELSITDIAFASGYGSGRQFNREFQRIFSRSPSELRFGRSSGARVAADGGLTLRLWYSGPLDWDALMAFLADRAVPGVESVDGRTYRRTVLIEDDPGVLELGPGGGDYLNLRVHLPHWETLIHVAARARRIACLDEDPTEPQRTLAADALLGPLLAKRPGVRLPGAWDPFEVGVSAILDQLLGRERSRRVAAHLVSTLGRPVPGLAPLGLTHAFPPAREMAQGRRAFYAAGLSPEQAEILETYAAGVELGAIQLDGRMSFEQLTSSIEAVPGISLSTAHFIALRMGEQDAFPAEEPALRRSLLQRAGRQGPVLGHSWRPWRSYAAAHLWAAA
jgi:AraC family transcriptional regulator, regulatory protein of adaptative response / DNA-3-methyladenine glycosylase II